MAGIGIEKWQDLIEQALRYRKTYGHSERWPVYRNYGRGIFPGFEGSTGGILPYNLTYEMKSTLIPNVYFRNPHVLISPRYKPGFHINAKVVEAIDNWILEEIGVKASMKTSVTDCYYCNRGILKLGYDGGGGGGGAAGEMPDFGEAVADLLNTPISQLGKKKGERVDYDVNVKSNMPWLSRLQPDMFLVPFGVRTLEDCPWADHIVLKKLEDVKNSRLYVDTKELKGTHVEILSKALVNSQYFSELSKDEDYVEVHEIRDFKRKEIKAFVPGYNKWIRKPEEDVLQIEGLPFVDFTFNEDMEYYWGPSDVQIIEPQQLEVNEARTQAMKHRRISLLKFLVEKDGMEPSEVDKLISEHVGPVAFTQGDPSKVAALLQPHIPIDLVQWTDTIRSDVRGMLGHSRQAAGEAPPGRRTKFEMQVVHGGRELRMDERRDIVADALVKVVRKINQIIFKNWTGERVAQVVGYDGARYWVAYTAEENRAEYNVKVDVESMVPSTKAQRKQEIVQIIQALGKNPRVNVDYLMKLLLREYPWMEAMQVLPEAQETMQNPMGQGDFVSLQNKMLGDRGMLEGRAGANAEATARAMG